MKVPCSYCGGTGEVEAWNSGGYTDRCPACHGSRTETAAPDPGDKRQVEHVAQALFKRDCAGRKVPPSPMEMLGEWASPRTRLWWRATARFALDAMADGVLLDSIEVRE